MEYCRLPTLAFKYQAVEQRFVGRIFDYEVGTGMRFKLWRAGEEEENFTKSLYRARTETL